MKEPLIIQRHKNGSYTRDSGFKSGFLSIYKVAIATPFSMAKSVDLAGLIRTTAIPTATETAINFMH